MRTRNLIIGGVAVFLGLAAVGAANDNTSTDSTTTPAVAANAQAAPAATPAPAAPAATSAPAAGNSAKIGQPVKVDDKLTVTVLDVTYATSNGQYQKPAAGYVFVAAKVRYEASDETLVSSGDWDVLADGTKQGQWTILMGDKWEPSLPFDTLAAGASTEGWITFEVPKPAKFAELRFDNDLFGDGPAQMVVKFALK